MAGRPAGVFKSGVGGRPAGFEHTTMPLPPRDFTCTHMSLGVRAGDFAALSPLYKFWPPGAMMRLQAAHDSGNLLAMHLSET